MLIHNIRATLSRQVDVTSKMVMMAFDAQVRKVSNLNGLQILLLMILECDQMITMEQIGKDLATFGQELEALLQPLFGKAYIQYAQSNEKQMIQLTDEGRRTLAQLWMVVERANNHVLSGFSESEKKQLNDFLQRIQTNCTAIINE